MGSLLVSITRALLPIIGKVHARVLGIKPLERDSIMCVEVRRHKGSPIKLRDGCEVRPGDRVIKLHLNDAWIAQRWWSDVAPGKSFPRGLFYYFKESMRILARKVGAGDYGEIAGVYAWTSFYSHAHRLGFQVVDLPSSLRIRLAEIHIAALRQARRIPWLKRYAAPRKPAHIKAVWLSKAELLRIHGAPQCGFPSGAAVDQGRT